MIQSLAFTCYPVADMARARRFYEQTLGLKVSMNYQDAWVEYDLAGGTFAITTMAEECRPSANGPFLGFEVDNLDAELARLRAAGVACPQEPYDSPVCRLAVMQDSAGNRFLLHQCKPPAPSAAKG